MLNYELDDIVLVANQVALHQRDPFVLEAGQIPQDDLPNQCPHRVELVDQADARSSVLEG